jgi:phospholipid-binding lipoprotein MlaA
MMNARAPLLAALLLAAAAAHAQSDDKPDFKPANDPFEGYNRAMFNFNEKLDNAIIAPVARGYQAAVPELARTGVSNFFGNFGDAWSAINQFLQGKGEAGFTMTFRVLTNTLFGIGGLFDVASDLGMERQSEDLGQTLGRWGLPAGPYFVWPVLGPSTIRDSIGRPFDLAWTPARLPNDSGARYAITGLQLIDARANLLGASKVLDDIALDKYTFVRDAYIARRRNQVYDGNPPPEPDDSPAAPTPAK